MIRKQLTNEPGAQGSSQGWKDKSRLHCIAMIFKSSSLFERERKRMERGLGLTKATEPNPSTFERKYPAKVSEVGEKPGERTVKISNKINQRNDH